jgi:hypothetical protein
VPTIDPKVAFYIGLTIFIAGIIANAGTTFLTGALPADVIPPVVKWCAIISTIGNGVLTYIAGSNMTNAGRLASVKAVPLTQRMDSFAESNPEVKNVVTTQALADATNSDKIVGPPAATGTKL